MEKRFTGDNSINEIIAKAGPEMTLYFPEGIMQFFPKECLDRPLKEWANDFFMPWGTPFDYSDLLSDANDMVLEGDLHRELIPLWVKEDFTVYTNDIHSACLIRLKHPEEGKNQSAGDIRPVVIVVPGGGYENISFHSEGIETARRLENAGYRAFILNYRFAPNRFPDPQLDLALAILFVRANAEKYGIDPNNLMTLGYSAGGHLCASEAALHEEIAESLAKELKERRPDLAEKYQGISIQPNKVCLGYPVISFLSEDHEPSFIALTGGDESLREHLSIEKQVDGTYPKTFVWTCADDSLVPPSNAVRMGEALKEQGVPSMLKVYPQGEHGCSVGDRTSAEGWMGEMLAFMK